MPPVKLSIGPTTRVFLIVVFAGLVGGCVSFLSGFSGELPTTETLGSYQVVVQSALGGIAGVVFAFLIANTDRADLPRLIALSLLAGIFWRPVIDAGGLMVSKQQEVNVAEAFEAQTAQVAASLAVSTDTEGVLRSYALDYQSTRDDIQWPQIRDQVDGNFIDTYNSFCSDPGNLAACDSLAVTPGLRPDTILRLKDSWIFQ